jgi:hypothetical protein
MRNWEKKAYIIVADYNVGQITFKRMTKYTREGWGHGRRHAAAFVAAVTTDMAEAEA